MIKEKILEGNTKILYQSQEKYVAIQFFKDAFLLDSKNIMEIPAKGVHNNNISSFIMSAMDSINIENHFIEKINIREQLVQFVDVLPLKVFITNVSCGSYVDKLGIEEGYVFTKPIIDFRLKNQKLNYPSITESQMLDIYFIEAQEIIDIKNIALRINDFLTGLFAAVGIRFIEAQLEFGRVFDGESFSIILSDELTPENLRLWNLSDNTRIDFEFINTNPSNAIFPYKEISKRLNI